MDDLKQRLILKIKQIHKIPPEDELDVENEVFLDFFATEMINWFSEQSEEKDGIKQVK